VQRDPMTKPAFSMIVPQYKNKLKMSDITKGAKALGYPLTEKVKYFYNGKEHTTDRSIPVGIMQILITEHLPQAMTSVRSTGGKNILTGQGQSGSAEGKGAQKIGEYDIFVQKTSSNTLVAT